MSTLKKNKRIKLAKKLMAKSPMAMRYTKECIRSVRFMNEPEAADYLNAKSDALKYMDKEKGREHGMKQFLDDKTFRPGLGEYDRKKAQKENAAAASKAAKGKAAAALATKAATKTRKAKPAAKGKTKR